MLNYPDINPVAFQIGPIKVFWYGITYLVGFFIAWLLASWRARKSQQDPSRQWTSEQVSDLIFYAAIGLILGGRVGYLLFYGLADFIHNPLMAFKIWQGGMSFHGGLIGGLIAVWLFSLKTKKNFFDVTDFTAPLVPLGLAAGRIGNFINGELWGRVTTVPWGMIFPGAGAKPRHPSQLYEFFLEGVLLFIILWWFSAKPRPRFAVTALAFFCYGVFRFFVEFYREPDVQLGFVAWHWLTMGQLLSLPMIVIGAVGFWCAYRCAYRQSNEKRGVEKP